ncbi:MAG: hypothetical protein HY043_03275 [Verrucomicrobia bacterium]|nr:hypothetical protein [Verrucomicrobiota bacterium]
MKTTIAKFRITRRLAVSWAAIFFLSAVAFGAQTSADATQFEPDIQAFEQNDKTNPPPANAILFIGSSSIRLWKTLAQDFPDHRVINRGFGGSQISDSVLFAERVVIPYRPRMIVFYAGGNDLNAGKAPTEVFGDWQNFVHKVQAKLPATRIAYISSAPNPARWAQVEQVKELNNLIAAYQKQDSRRAFIDVFSQMLGADGRPRPEIFSDDRLHMNPEGYRLWTQIVKPHLTPAAH